MKLALAQLEIESGNVTGNVDRAERAIAEAASRDADLVALPEVFTVGYFAFDGYARTAEGIAGPTLSQIAERADDHGIGVLAGSVVEDLDATARETDVPTPASEGLANTSVLFDRDGERIGLYRKHHLFGYASAEADLLVAGEYLDRAIAEFEGFTVGMTTCYDLRFPELYRDFADRGVTLILVPSAWPYPRIEHWTTLARARAIENLSYLAAVNGSGEFEDATLLGRSTVYDPWGTTIASSGDEPALVTAEISPERIESVREEFPALRDRRS